MTTITLNQNLLAHSLNNKSNINDLMDLVLSLESCADSTITNLCIDGENIDPRTSEIIPEKTLDGIESILIETKNHIELTFEALDSCTSYIDILSNKILTLVELYKVGEEEKANNLFAELIDILDLYIQLISRIHRTLKEEFKEQAAQCADTLQGLEIHLLSVIKALVPAKECNDIIMLSDLLEYELIDNLTKWKITAIPMLKKIQNS